MLSVIEELIEEMTDSDLNDLLTWYPHKKHAGKDSVYLLEDLHPDNYLIDTLFEYFESTKFYPVFVKSGIKAKTRGSG